LTVPINYIEIRFFAHATEDPEKVVTAARNIFPTNFANEIAFKKSKLEGHYGNPIITFEARVKDKKVIKAFLENLALKLSSLEKESLLTNIEKCFEKGSLYIRFDKQAAFDGEIKFCAVDPIHIRLKFSKSRLEDVIRICRDLRIVP